MNEPSSPIYFGETMTIHLLQHLSEKFPEFESSVLVRELKFFLDLGQGCAPEVKVRIWNKLFHDDPVFIYELSHFVHTPTQFGPYEPGEIRFQTELDAIEGALSALTKFIAEAVQQELRTTSQNNWMVKNKGF
jgi:hypothetical protein